jgi:Domain of unknown function (DUF4157)
MESRFGRDFGEVHVHTDGKATESAKAAKAFAYMVGSDLVFGKSRYAQATSVGMRFIAHELVNVLQLERGMGGSVNRKAKSVPSEPPSSSTVAAGEERRQWEVDSPVVEVRPTGRNHSPCILEDLGPWIIVPADTRFECGVEVVICANSHEATAMVVEKSFLKNFPVSEGFVSLLTLASEPWNAGGRGANAPAWNCAGEHINRRGHQKRPGKILPGRGYRKVFECCSQDRTA